MSTRSVRADNKDKADHYHHSYCPLPGERWPTSPCEHSGDYILRRIINKLEHSAYDYKISLKKAKFDSEPSILKNKDIYLLFSCWYHFDIFVYIGVLIF